MKQIISDYAERIAKGQYVSVIYVVEKESIAKVLREEMSQTVVSDRFQIMKLGVFAHPLEKGE
ncbi:hypothetical protein P9Z36_33705 [Bacillus cereus]|nr:hypothetical protein [Bacillus cereus]